MFGELQDINTFYFVALVSFLVTCIRMVNTDNLNERVIGLFVLGLTGVFIYKRYTKSKTQAQSTQKAIDDVLGALAIEHGAGNYLTLAARTLLEKDAVLLDALSLLREYTKYDKAVISAVITGLIKFYDAYAKILLKPHKDSNARNSKLVSLHDLRFEILRNLHSLYVSIPYARHAGTFERITLVIQSATYKCLNVLKNKYGGENTSIVNMKAPFASNALEPDV